MYPIITDIWLCFCVQLPIIMAWHSGADPGIYVSGGALDRQGVWGPSRSPAGPGQRPVGGPWELGIWGGNGNAKMAVF